VNAGAWIGLAVMVGVEAGTLAQVEPFWSWTTPIAWTGFIVFADSIVWEARGDSWLRSNPGEFAFLAAASIALWLVFEGYNQVIRNWYYVGLPENRALRLFGYAWSFATVWPAIFEGAELAALTAGPGSAASLRVPARDAPPGDAAIPERGPASGAVAWSQALVGGICLASPFLVPPSVARYLAAPVWLGFIFLLDPINARLGAPSLLADFSARRYNRAVNLLASGLACGLLWEFWNYWSRAKWHYTVPIMATTKVFEMPLPGYLGFPPFAVECFTMYALARRIVAPGLDRRLAL
jgi:hypothetical protein